MPLIKLCLPFLVPIPKGDGIGPFKVYDNKSVNEFYVVEVALRIQ